MDGHLRFILQAACCGDETRIYDMSPGELTLPSGGCKLSTVLDASFQDSDH